jgi:ketosteroid isomerase-like protein
MGSENVEIVRRAYEAFNREGRNAMLEFLHPEIEWDESELPARRPGVYHGHEGVTRLLNENASLWEDINVVIDEIIEGGSDQVVAMIRVTGRGRNTGVDVELATAQVWTLRAGKAKRVRLYLDRQEAMEVAGSAPGTTA